MADLWTKSNNYLLKTLVERISLAPGDLSLPLSTQNVNIQLISGKLPEGLRIEGTDIIGTPVEVIRELEHTFVLRATTATQLQDRTFKLKVTGADVRGGFLTKAYYLLALTALCLYSTTS